MFWINIFRNLIQILREGQTPKQIAGGAALGLVAGLTPLFTLQGVVVWLIILTLDVNLSAVTFITGLAALFAYILDPLFHRLGFALLVDATFLRGLWTALYNAPLAPLTRFYNTVVLGSFVFAIVCAIPLYFGGQSFVLAYRRRLHESVERWKIYQILHKSFLVRWYLRMRDAARLHA